MDQRLYLPYQYYLYQVEANPAMESYLQQRAEKLHELASAGPKERVRFPERPAVDPTRMGLPRAVMQRGRGRGRGASRGTSYGWGSFSARRNYNPRQPYANTSQVSLVAEKPEEETEYVKRSTGAGPTLVHPGCETEDENEEVQAEN